MSNETSYTRIPTRWIGPIRFQAMNGLFSQLQSFEITAPIATYETALFASVARGAKVTRLAKTLKTTVLSDHMTRSILFEASSAATALEVSRYIQTHQVLFQETIVAVSSKHAKLIDVHVRIVASMLFVRFAFQTGEASGHNMTTIAADKIAAAIVTKFPTLRYLSVSGNYCTDKKASSVNAILGRGKSVVAELLLSRKILKDALHTTPEAMVELNIKKNLIGSIVSGGVQTANAHYANMLLAFYIATGQDGANVVEGSQGLTHCELRGDDLYFSVSLPNIIVGTIGNGKQELDVKEALKQMELTGEGSSERLAQIAAALVLCGELSLLAALTNENELSNSHIALERGKQE
jgi:hydroxymethylglutaryl-CoA reductase (NADPH)